MRFIVAHGAGGLVDTIARALAQHLSVQFGQPVVVDNRPGASEAIGAEALAKSAPDGHTIMMASEVAMVLNSLLMKNLAYNPQRDFTPISMVAESLFYLVVNPSVPAHTVSELIALAKSKPGKLTFASIGNGTHQHLLGEMFKARAKVDLLHVPYKGSGPAVLDLVAGRIDVMFQGGGGTLAHIRSGKLRALAATSDRRPAEVQYLPTMIQAGVPEFEASPWFALFGPADLPRPIVDRLNREVGEMLRAPETLKKLAPLGISLTPGTPEALAERIRKDQPFWARIIREAHIEAE